MYQYPPNWGYPMIPPPNDDHFRKGLEFATRLALREEREKQRRKDREKKERDDWKKQARESRRSFLICLELYILGVISYPIVGPLYKLAVSHYGAQ